MAHETIKKLSIPKAGLLDGLSACAAWRKAKRGGYGRLVRKHPDKPQMMVSVAELERVTRRVFTPAEIEAVARAPARSKLPTAQRTRLYTRDECMKAITLAVAARDASWRHWASPDGLPTRRKYPLGPPRNFDHYPETYAPKE